MSSRRRSSSKKSQSVSRRRSSSRQRSSSRRRSSSRKSSTRSYSKIHRLHSHPLGRKMIADAWLSNNGLHPFKHQVAHSLMMGQPLKMWMSEGIVDLP